MAVWHDVRLDISRCSEVEKLTPHGWKHHFADQVAARHDELASRFAVAPE